jgi:hypothetical protein
MKTAFSAFPTGCTITFQDISAPLTHASIPLFTTTFRDDAVYELKRADIAVSEQHSAFNRTMGVDRVPGASHNQVIGGIV